MGLAPTTMATQADDVTLAFALERPEYVRGEVHTANLDSFWALLKRGIMGTYHHVSKKYLSLYLAECLFRFNNRKEADIFGKAVAGC